MGRSITWVDGQWHEGNPPLMGPMDQSFWMGTQVFDGGRVFGGLAPDLDLHCARAVNSARVLGMRPKETPEEILALGLEGARRLQGGEPLYIRPTFFATGGFMYPDPAPAACRFLMIVHEEPMPDPPKGFTSCLSPWRRPDPRTAPTLAKASALYPVTGFAYADAEARGFGNPVLLDYAGNVAEFAGSNLFLVKDGRVSTPAANKTFLAGITRRRVIGLLAEKGVAVEERTIAWDEVLAADEIFSTGNYMKVSPCTRMEDRDLQPGPVYRQARALYMQWAREKGLRL